MIQPHHVGCTSRIDRERVPASIAGCILRAQHLLLPECAPAIDRRGGEDHRRRKLCTPDDRHRRIPARRCRTEGDARRQFAAQPRRAGLGVDTHRRREGSPSVVTHCDIDVRAA